MTASESDPWFGDEGVTRLRALSNAAKVSLFEVLIACAWTDGVVAPEERKLVEEFLALAEIGEDAQVWLLASLEERPGPLHLRPLEAPGRRFVLERAILLSLIDDDQADEELVFLDTITRQLGGDEAELSAILVEVAGFYERNRDAIHGLGSPTRSLGKLRAVLMERAAAAVRSSLGKLVQEIKETGELAKLLGAASIRQLTPEEGQKVKAQLLDICKTVPTLAIFLLPGGGFLLPVLIKLLPFDILPTAFGDEGPGAGNAG
jgi:hypothetical protein